MSVGYRKVLISSQVDGPTLTSAAAATCLPAQARRTIAANLFDQAGQLLFVRIAGRLSNVVTSPGTARFDLRLGGTPVFDTLAMPLNVVAKTNVPFWLEILMTLRAVGNPANFFGQHLFVSESYIGSPAASAGGNGTIVGPYNTAPVVGGNFDSTAAQQLDCFYTQTVGTAGTSMTVHQFVVEAVTGIDA